MRYQVPQMSLLLSQLFASLVMSGGSNKKYKLILSLAEMHMKYLNILIAYDCAINILHCHPGTLPSKMTSTALGLLPFEIALAFDSENLNPKLF